MAAAVPDILSTPTTPSRKEPDFFSKFFLRREKPREGFPSLLIEQTGSRAHPKSVRVTGNDIIVLTHTWPFFVAGGGICLS